MLKNSVLSAASSVALISDIWSGNAKKNYISVVAHYVSADWEWKKGYWFEVDWGEAYWWKYCWKFICVVEEFALIDKIFSVTLDNASSNAKAIETLTPMFAGYLGPDPTTEHVDPSNRKYSLMHQRCACHIINLIIKSGLKRFKPYLEDFRSAINFLNSSNQALWGRIFGDPGSVLLVLSLSLPPLHLHIHII